MHTIIEPQNAMSFYKKQNEEARIRFRRFCVCPTEPPSVWPTAQSSHQLIVLEDDSNRVCAIFERCSTWAASFNARMATNNWISLQSIVSEQRLRSEGVCSSILSKFCALYILK
uniref:N-acetyltransferase domain-containing protein n=1 Tax=Steinernema glaseri TaxID=37863 RepID=A0A1I8A6W7_9BILA